MSILTALTALLIFSSSATAGAQIFAPNCSTADSEWDWTFNSLNQNPCIIAAYLESACNNGEASIYPLPQGWTYQGPSNPDLYGDDSCLCNTVTYSLLSACGACQGNDWVTWSEYVYNCTKTLPPSTFPSPVPAGTSVPQWALLDVTFENEWDSNKSLAIGDSPEIGPGSLIGNPGSVITIPTGTFSTSAIFTGVPSTDPSFFSSSGGSSPNMGAIVGGVVAAVAVIAIAVLGFFYLRRRRTKAPTSAFVDEGASPPHNDGAAGRKLLDDSTDASLSTPEIQASMAPMRVYNPNDPTTFPGQQGAPKPGGYNGLPMV